MEDVIKKIIKIEETAQDIMATTIKENEAKIKTAERDMVELEELIIGDAYKRAKDMRKSELGENAVYAKEMRKECAGNIMFMETRAKENEEEWVRFLVDRVLGD